MVSELFDEDRWEPVTDEFEDITYHRADVRAAVEIGRASCRERVCLYV